MSKLMVSALPVRAVLAGAARCGISAEDILAAARVGRGDLAASRIPAVTEERLWSRLLRADATVGVRAAQATPRGALGAVEYAVRSAPTLGRGIEVIVEHTAPWYDLDIFRATASGDGVHLSYRSPHATERRMSALAAEYLLAIVVRLLRELTSTAQILRHASVRHGNLRSTPHLVGAFGVPVEIRARRDQVVFAREALTLASREADDALHAILVAHLEDLAVERPRRNDLIEATCRAIEERLETHASVDRVARALGVSARLLQERLRAQGVTYRQLLEQVRISLAKRFLRETDAELSAIADRVGYGDPSSFHRGFKRATGTTPAAFRDACLASREGDRSSPPPSPRDVA